MRINRNLRADFEITIGMQIRRNLRADFEITTGMPSGLRFHFAKPFFSKNGFREGEPGGAKRSRFSEKRASQCDLGPL